MRWLFLVFIVTPLVELYLLLWFADLTSLGAAVALTLVTGIVGGSLAKREGLKVWRRWNQALANMQPPEQGVIDGVLILIGGVLLITPGILTDLVGFSLLAPPTRDVVARAIRRRIDAHLERRGHQGMRVIETSGSSSGDTR
jgi:UPF0716 protein FxsA